MGVRATTLIESHTPDDKEPACVSFYSLDDKAKEWDHSYAIYMTY